MKASDLKAEAEKMVAEGTMPGAEELVKALAEVRAEYQPKILAARAKGPEGTKRLGEKSGKKSGL